ncbi:MAG: PEP-CTERM sorting domain-containing protein, partial [Chthoniobacterales bacterium]
DEEISWFAALVPGLDEYTLVTTAQNEPRVIPLTTHPTQRLSYRPSPVRSGNPTPADAMNLALERIFSPTPENKNRLTELLTLARETGTLVPSTAYIVVENSAQWKMLELTEKKTTSGHEALTLSGEPAATPEPATIALLILAGAALFFHHRRKHRPLPA